MSRTTQHTLTLPWVEEATQGFVFCDDMRQAVSLALAAGVNLIFSGPGGHAKSEFLAAVFDAIFGQEPFVKSFGQGTGTEELFGGIDFDALNRPQGAALQYNPAHSFLDRRIAVFEELFDAPSRVLTALKDVLTARELRNGHQRHPMLTRVIAAATNHSPQEIAEGGPEIEALIQRFPIQLEVKWSRYNKSEFAQLFATVIGRCEDNKPQGVTWADVEALQQRSKAVTVSLGMQLMLAEVVSELRRDGVPMSPRTAIAALQLAQAAAAINGRDRIVPDDIRAVAFLPGAISHRSKIDQLIDSLRAAIESEEKLELARNELNQLAERLRNDTSSALTVANKANAIAADLTSLRVTSDQYDRRLSLINDARSLAAEASSGGVRKALSDFESRVNELEHRFESSDTTQQWESFCGDARRVLRGLFDLSVNSAFSGLHNRLINDVQSIIADGEEELRKARAEEDALKRFVALADLDARVNEIVALLKQNRNDAKAREGLLKELDQLRTTVSLMQVDFSLEEERRKLMSRISLVYISNRPRV